MDDNFEYLLDKIEDSDFTSHPFEHIYIENFFSKDHFKLLKEDSQIRSTPAKDPEELLCNLESHGWIPRPFGGCTTDKGAYLRWRNNPNEGFENTNTAEGFGMVYKLDNPSSRFIHQLKSFLASDEFFSFLGKKFGIAEGPYRIAAGCHKYLSGYEISPHPDQRSKALTYMININPDPNSENNNHHTHYMKLKDKYKYIYSFWDANDEFDRSWLPWHWCETVTQQSTNNSIVIFSPSNYSLHAVKAQYNDLNYQRTQFYGNLWYKKSPKYIRPSWESLEISPKPESRKVSLRWKIKNKIMNYF